MRSYLPGMARWWTTLMRFDSLPGRSKNPLGHVDPKALQTAVLTIFFLFFPFSFFVSESRVVDFAFEL